MLWQTNLNKCLHIIEQGLSNYNAPYVSMSWGKDSILLYHLIQLIDKTIPVIFVDSGYCLPDTYIIRDKLLKIWKPIYHELKQPTDYVELSKVIGLPHERDSSVQGKAVKILKKSFLDEFALDNSLDLCFWGIRTDESKGRFRMFRKNGYFITSTEVHKCHPIALLTQQQLWYFYDKFNIPKNEIYNKTKFLKPFQIRNTGWVSTDGANQGRLQWLRYYYPEHYIKLQKEFPTIKRNV